MTPRSKKILSLSAIAIAAVAVTLGLSNLRFFEQLRLKAQDLHFVLRGSAPIPNIVILAVDNEPLAAPDFLTPSLFWHEHYADAIKGAARAGAKVFVLDEAFTIPVEPYEKDPHPHLDSDLAAAFAANNPVMPIVCAFVPEAMGAQREGGGAVPLNMIAGAMGMSAYANLTADADDFVRTQELIEAPKAGVPDQALTRGMALRAAEKFLGVEAHFREGRLYLGDRLIPANKDRQIIINFSGPPETVPHISVYRFLAAAKKGDRAQHEKKVKGKVVLLGPYDFSDRHDTPFYTAFAGAEFRSPGVEVHANALNTLLTGDYLQPVHDWARIIGLLFAAGSSVTFAAIFEPRQTVAWSIVSLLVALGATHLLFRQGWLLSTSEVATAYVIALNGGEVYRFATAERLSSFFRGAVAVFVGKQVATSLEESGCIG